MVHSELLEILVCPETKQKLRLAGKEVLDRVNQGVAKGYVRNQCGEQVKGRVEEALVREDGRVLYLVQDGIPVMLLDEAILLDSLP